MTDPHDKHTLQLPLSVGPGRAKFLRTLEKRRCAAPPAPPAPSEGLQTLVADGFELQEHRIQIGPLDV